MARETKVGLLAGLAFIICFAVILANRGAKGPPGLADTFLPNGGLELPKLVQRNQAATGDAAANAARNRNRQPIRQPQQEAALNPGTNQENRSQSPQHAMGDPAPAIGAQLPLPTNAEPVRMNPESTLAMNTRPVDVLTPSGVNTGLERALGIHSQLESALRNESPVPMTATNPTAGGPVATPGRLALNDPVSVAPAEQRTAPVPGTSYTVKPTDTLSSIASAHYGTKSKQAVETIFDANRSVLSDINNVKMGLVLVIPQFRGAVAEKTQPVEKSQSVIKTAHPAEKTTERKKAESDKTATRKKPGDKEPVKKKPESVAGNEKAGKNFKWYQVKKNDRFASIAREQLGDAGRWQEVYELNKDKFPDPQRIREGVRIKLPTSTAIASAVREENVER